MRKFIFITFFLSFSVASFAFNSYYIAKKDTSQKTRILSVGCGYIKTSLNFFKNSPEGTNANGFSGRIMFQTSETFRFAACFSQAQSVTISPTWINVNNSFIDLDAHFMMHFADQRNIAYFVLGASGQYWQGYYTGIHDLNAWKLNAKPNSDYKALYFGAKIGMGVEIKIYGPISGYGEFLFRFTKTDVGTGLSDVVYGLGIKVNLANFGHSKSSKHKHSILGFKDKYHWF